MKTKRFFFASANTGDGFVNFLDKINENDGNEFLYILKGGPGCGKSTFMKSIAQYFYKNGEDVECFLCSTDTTSLDGVRIPSKNVAIIDGTAPHVANVDLLNINSKIIDLGQFVSDDVVLYKKEIRELIFQKKKCFEKIYDYLKCAKILDDVNFEIAKGDIGFSVIKRNAKNIFSKIKQCSEKGEERTLFLRAVNSPNVPLEKINNFKIKTADCERYEKFLILSELENILKKNKIKFTKFLDVLNPKYIDSILINGILVKNKKSDKKIINNGNLIKKIIKNVKNEIKNAKVIHSKIEKIYLPYVDFDKIDKKIDEIINEIKTR